MTTTRVRILAGVVLLVAVGAGIWWWLASGRESTDDAQVDAHITPIAARIGGTVIKVPVEANQEVEAGAVLVEIDKRDYEIALERARAELADAEAAALAAQAGVPITSTTASSNEVTAQGGVEQAEVSYLEAQQGVEVARTRLATAQARQREAVANASKASRDVERLKPLLAKDEIAQQQFDATAATATATAAAADSAEAQVKEAELGIRVAESRLKQASVGRQQASAELKTAQTAPSQIAASRARAAAADAKIGRASCRERV